MALPCNTRSTLTHSPLLALALTRASRPRKKMNSRHKKTGDDRPGDNSPVCWPLIETEKQLRQVTEENGLLIGWVATELTSTPAIHAMTRRTRSRRREPLARPDDTAQHTCSRARRPTTWNAPRRSRTPPWLQLLCSSRLTRRHTFDTHTYMTHTTHTQPCQVSSNTCIRRPRARTMNNETTMGMGIGS